MSGLASAVRTRTRAGEQTSGPARLILAGALVLMAAIAAALVLGVGPAGAHSVVVGSDPAENAVVDTFPDRISVEFNEQPAPAFAVLDAIGPDGRSLAAAEPVVERMAVSVAVDRPQVAGAYNVVYRVTSADGHAIEGQIPFTVSGSAIAVASTAPADEAAEQATAAPAADEQAGSDDSGAPVWPFVVIAILVAAGGLVAVLRPRRRTTI